MSILKKLKGARGLLVYHEGSIVKGLMDLYPKIGFEKKLLQAALGMYFIFFFCW